jgi:glycosyltransferase involved in cell wall biosynthesis
MRIGFTIRLFTPGSGGLQHHAAELVGHLRSLGHETVVVTRAVTRAPSYQDAFYFSEDRTVSDDPARIVRHPRWLNPLMWVIYKCVHRPTTRRLGISLYVFIYGGKVARALRGVDVIHHIGQGSEMIGFAAGAAAKKLNVPFVVQPTAHPGQWGDGRLDVELYKKADALLAHTRYEADWLKTLGLNQPIEVVGNGIEGRSDGDGQRFRQKYQIKGPIVLFLGRKEADKGYPLLKESFATVVKEMPDATLVCIGPGSKRQPTSEMPGVLELDFLDDTPKHDALAACDVLCVPSEAESFGLVYMEAACYKKAIVARDIPVLRELLGDAAVLLGKNADQGLNKTELDSNLLGQNLIRLLNNPVQRQELGAAAFAKSRDFIWPNVVRHFVSAYQNAMPHKRSVS